MRGRKSKTKLRDVIDLYSKGMSMEDVGKTFGVTKQRIDQILKKNGIRRSSHETWLNRAFSKKSIIIRMWNKKKSLVEISKRVKHGVPLVKFIVRDYVESRGQSIDDVIRQRRVRTYLDENEIVELYKTFGLQHISDTFGVSWKRIKTILIKKNINLRSTGRPKTKGVSHAV